jgi:hypothetical protein
VVGGDVSKLPAIGSRVRVPFGLGTVEGEVIDAYDSGYGPQVMVSILLWGSNEPVTHTIRAEAVELVA